MVVGNEGNKIYFESGTVGGDEASEIIQELLSIKEKVE
jgi:hypothetical protein